MHAAAELDICALAFSRDGRKLAAASRVPDRRLTVWDWEKGQLLSTMQLSFDATVLSFNPMNSESLCAMGDGVMQVVGVKKAPQETTYVLKGSAVSFASAALCHAWTDRGTLLVGCQSGEMLVFDTESMRLLPGPIAGAWLKLDSAIRRALDRSASVPQ